MTRYKNGISEILSIFVLANLAIAQPLFDLLSRNSEFFIAKHSKPVDIILFAILVSIAIPGILVLIEIAAGWIHPILRKVIHGLFFVVLAMMAIMPALTKMHSLPGTVLIAIAAFAAVLLLVLVTRWRAARLFFNYLSPSILIIPALFLMNSSISKILHAESSNLPMVSRVSSTTPVVMVVLDELPLISLLDGKEQIDPVRYPNLHKLMEDSVWFRKATTVADDTPDAVGAILTGRYPDPSRLPIVKDYPNNLFTMLAGSYELKVFEPITKLCPNTFNVSGEKDLSLVQRMRSIVSDLSAVYLQVILPSEFSSGLPQVRQTWGNFWNQNQSGNALTRIRDPYPQRLEQFQKFLNLITPTKKPGLFFLHVLLPHIPWEYLPSGKYYNYRSFGPMGTEGLSLQDQVWCRDEWVVARGYQRHLLQVGFVDKMIGELLDRLHQTGLYDRALVIVTADHGASFHPGNSFRSLNQGNFTDILPVPLLMKLPQSSRKGIVEKDFESVDVLPTIADVLKIPVTWQLDGISGFKESAVPRTEKRVFRNVNTKSRTWQTFDSGKVLIEGSLKRKLDLFGSDNNDGIYRINESSDFTASKSVPPGATDFKTELKNQDSWDNVNLSSVFIPSFITGRILFEKQTTQPVLLGVVINGSVQGITRSYLPGNPEGWLKTLWLRSANDGQLGTSMEGIHGFGIVLPQSSFQQGKNKVEIVDLQEWAKTHSFHPDFLPSGPSQP